MNVEILSALSRYSSLFFMMVKRDIAARYKGSWLGLFWSAINPLLLMVVYGFVFGVIFKARWPAQGDTEVSFMVLLFCGLIVHMMFADVLGRSASVVRDNANYVKKVVFPLTIFGGVVSTVASGVTSASSAFSNSDTTKVTSHRLIRSSSLRLVITD